VDGPGRCGFRAAHVARSGVAALGPDNALKAL
jgi:hypothetical protein